MPNTENSRSAAEAAYKAYKAELVKLAGTEYGDDRENVTDLITDLLHLIDSDRERFDGYGGNEVVETASDNYWVECGEAERAEQESPFQVVASVVVEVTAETLYDDDAPLCGCGGRHEICPADDEPPACPGHPGPNRSRAFHAGGCPTDEEPDDDSCTICGADLTDNEGYDGLCGEHADAADDGTDYDPNAGYESLTPNAEYDARRSGA